MKQEGREEKKKEGKIEEIFKGEKGGREDTNRDRHKEKQTHRRTRE